MVTAWEKLFDHLPIVNRFDRKYLTHWAPQPGRLANKINCAGNAPVLCTFDEFKDLAKPFLLFKDVSFFAIALYTINYVPFHTTAFGALMLVLGEVEGEFEKVGIAEFAELVYEPYALWSRYSKQVSSLGKMEEEKA